MIPALVILSPHPLLTDPARLKILSLLAMNEVPMSFNQVLETLKLTKGNLSAHMTKLQESELVEIKKQFVNNKPLTTLECTPKGRDELNSYLKQIQTILQNQQKVS